MEKNILDQQQDIKKKISDLVDKLAKLKYKNQPFKPGETVIPPAGKVIDIFPSTANAVEVLKENDAV